LATGSSDLTVRLWLTTTFECLRSLEGLSSWPTNVKFVFFAGSSGSSGSSSVAVSCHSGVLHVEAPKEGTLAPYDGGHEAGE